MRNIIPAGKSGKVSGEGGGRGWGILNTVVCVWQYALVRKCFPRLLTLTVQNTTESNNKNFVKKINIQFLKLARETLMIDFKKLQTNKCFTKNKSCDSKFIF